MPTKVTTTVVSSSNVEETSSTREARRSSITMKNPTIGNYTTLGSSNDNAIDCDASTNSNKTCDDTTAKSGSVKSKNKRKAVGNPASISPMCTPKKAKKADPDKATSKSSSSPSTKQPKKSKSKTTALVRPNNQPSIGSFFLQMKVNKKVDNGTASTATSNKKSSNDGENGDSESTEESKMSTSKSVLEVIDSKEASSSSIPSNNDRISCNNHTQPVSSTLPPNNINNEKGNMMKKSAPETSRKASRTKVVHLPHLITQDLDPSDIFYQTEQHQTGKKQLNSTKACKKGAVAATKKDKKSSKDPLKPKYFKTAYVSYQQAVRPTVVKENPEMNFSEITKLIGKMFKELSVDERKVYDEMAAVDKARYQMEMQEYSNKQEKSSEVESREVQQEDQSNDIKITLDTKVTQSDNQLIVECNKLSDLSVDLFAENGGEYQETSDYSKSESANDDTVEPKAVNISQKEQVKIEDDQNNDDITLASHDDDISCDEGLETKEDQAFISLEDEGTCDPKLTEKDDETNENLVNDQAIDSNAIERLDAVQAVEHIQVNILQPRKKVITPVITTLQPRKKVKVNQLQPRKKNPINELKPRKKVKSDSFDSTKSNNQSSLKPKKLFAQSDDKVNGVLVVKSENTEHRNATKSPTNAVTSKPILETKNSPKALKTNPTRTESDKNQEESTQVAHLSEEEKLTLVKYQKMKSDYLHRVKEIVDQAINGAVEEEDFQKNPIGNEKSGFVDGSLEITDFRDEWVELIATLVQGSPLPLRALANRAREIISDILEPNTTVALETVSAKIKILAERTQYLSSIPLSNSNTAIDTFNDVNESNMWRWELISLELLPDDKKSQVKKARAARKKLKSHQKAILKLIQSISDYETHIASSSKTTDSIQKRMVKINTDEEKVLKYERDAEKVRLQQEAKIMKEKEKEQKLIEKEAEKDRKKEEAAKKQEEKARLEAEKDRKKEESSKKQKARMLSFFKTSSPKDKRKACEHVCSNKMITLSSESFDSTEFRKKLNCNEKLGDSVFTRLSDKAIQSRRRKTKKVNVRVFASVVPDNPFEQQPYDEERKITVWNKYKFLSFHEDYRPPYHGTWTKPRSKLVNGKHPFGKDITFLNYDVDSEAEWEEEDNEQGDDCSVEDADDEELEGDEDTTKYNYQDGWLAHDGDLDLEDDDEETLAMRRKKAALGDAGDTQTTQKMISASVIAPLWGGLPQFRIDANCPNLVPDLVEGMELDAAQNLLESHQGEMIMPKVSFCLDPFPPISASEKKQSASKSQSDIGTKKSNQEMTDEDMKAFAKFVHRCTLKSKELIVEELRLNHGNIIPSRAQANRKIDLIATKRRLKKGAGVIWEVKDDVLKSLGLEELITPPQDDLDNQENKSKSDNVDAKTDEKATKSKKSEKTKVKGKEKKAKKTKAKGKAAIANEKDHKANGNSKPVESVQATSASSDESPAVLISPAEKTPKKRKQSEVSKASANLLASFLSKKKKLSGA